MVFAENTLENNMHTAPIIISETFPQKRSMPLDGLYLGQNLLGIFKRLGRSFIYTNYVSDPDDIVAKKDKNGNFQVPKEIINTLDWLLFRELEAQADVIITGSAYLRGFSALNNPAENILSGFEPGCTFENLGNWRLRHGFKKRSPDIAIIARNLDFKIPDIQKSFNRKVVVFTTNTVADSDKAKIMEDDGIPVIGCGMQGVEGKLMIDYLSAKMGYRTIEMTAGPAVLKILLQANVLDRIYISQVQRKIPVTDLSAVKKILPGEEKFCDQEDFILSHKYVVEKVALEDAITAPQQFLRYDHKRFLLELQRHN